MDTKKKQAYRLGIDVGTSSVAIAAVTLMDGKPTSILHTDLVIFGEPVLPKEMKLKNEHRRLARAMRKNIARKRARIAKVLHLAEHAGVDVKKLSTVITGKQGTGLQTTHELWRVRAQAVDPTVKIPMDQLFAVFLRMAKNRGYFGRAPSVQSKGELGAVSAGIQQSETLLASGKTLGQVMWEKASCESRLSQAKLRKLSEQGTYVLRSQILAEFDKIIAAQATHHQILSESYQWRDEHGEQTRHFFGLKPKTFAEALRIAIFHQRPLKGYADKIGPCALEGESHRRVSAAHPYAQAFRIEKVLGDLRWGSGKDAVPLSIEQKNLIRDLLNSQKEIKFSAIYKKLDTAGLGQDGLAFNLHSARRESLKGNSTVAAMKTIGMLDTFHKLSEEIQCKVMTAWADHFVSPELWGFDDQASNIERLFGKPVRDFLDSVSTETKNGLERLAASGFDGGRMPYGEKALKRLVDYMREHNVDEYTAQDILYPESHKRAAVTGVLPELYDPSLGKPQEPGQLYVVSPVVRRALQESRKVIMKCVERFGQPESVVVELLREMKKTLDERKKIEYEQGQNERENIAAKNELEKQGYPVSRANVVRYRLWKEQAQRCPYSGAVISMAQAMDGAVTHFEHILPKHKQGVGNRFEDAVLAFRKMNDLKAAQATPYEAAMANPTVWDWNTTVAACKEIAKQSRGFKKKADLIVATDIRESAAIDDEGFVDRQLAETSYIGKVVRSWCQALSTDVSVVRGTLTADSRRVWGLDTVLEEVRIAEGKHQNASKAESLFYKPHPFRAELVFDKRCDHRQHLIDAVTVALSTRAHYMNLVRWRNSRASRTTTERVSSPEAPFASLRDDVKRIIQGTVVWHKPDRMLDGELFLANPFRLGLDGETLSKKGEEARVSFNPVIDKLVNHMDRKGRSHQKVLKNSETAGLELTEKGFVVVPLHSYRERIKRMGFKHASKDIFFKNDLVFVPAREEFFRIAQLSTRDGLLLVCASETRTFGECSGTGLTIAIGNVAKARALVKFASRQDLGRFIRARHG